MVAQAMTAFDPIMALTADEWQASAARDDLLSFTRRMFPTYETADHHRLIGETLEAVERGEIDRLLIIMPPRHGKSELASKHFPAWYLGRHPERRVIGCSHGASLAYRFSRQARNVVADDRYPFAATLASDLASVHTWDLTAGGGYLAAGVGTTITGTGADLLILDDPVKSADEADSETRRDHAWQWYTDTAYPRLQDRAAIVVIGTRWHADDLIGRLLSAQATGGDQWHILHLPAIDEAGNALWPQRYPLPELERRKANMSSRMWEAQFQGNPLPAEGGMFKRQWWQRYRVLPPITRAELVMDAAFKEGVANDYTALALWGTDGLGSAYLINAWRARVEFPGLLRLARDAYAWSLARYPGLPLVIEDKASGQSAVQVLRTADGSNLALPIVAYAPPGNLSKTARAEGITGMVEGGRVWIPESAPWLEDWIAEHERFPLGTHDDWVDTSSMGLSRLIVTAQTVVRIW